MPNDKMYKVGIGIDKKSQDKFRKDLESLIKPFEEAMKDIESNGLNAGNRSKAKSELTSIMKFTEKQVKAVQDMASGIIPSDEKQLNALKQNVQGLVAFMSDAMQRMSKVGASTDWMKNGVSFVDTFIHMKSTLQTTGNQIEGLQAQIGDLTKSFNVLKEALVAVNPDAFGKRFGAEVRATTDGIKKAQALINNLKKQEHKGIQNELKIKKTDKDNIFTYDNDVGIDELKEDHAGIEAEIKKHFATITQIETQYANSKKSPYGNKKYRDAVHSLFVELQNFENLKGAKSFEDAFAHTGSEATSSIKGVTAEITAATDSAVKQIKDALSGIEGIEIGIAIPDANSQEFTTKINEFVKQAAAQFEKNPVKLTVDLTSPFDTTKQGELTKKQRDLSKKSREEFEKIAAESNVDVSENLVGLDSPDTSRITRNVLNSFKKVYDAITAGQKTITGATKKWRKDMEQELTITPKLDTSRAKEALTETIFALQEELDKGDPLYINTSPDTRKFVDDLQTALKDKQITVDVKADNIDASGTPLSLENIKLAAGFSTESFDNNPQATRPPQSAIPSIDATKRNTEAVDESTRVQTVLKDAIQRLQSSVDANKEAKKISESDNEKRIRSALDNQKKINELREEIDDFRGKGEDASDIRDSLRQEIKQIEAQEAADNEQYRAKHANFKNIFKNNDTDAIQREFSEAVQFLQSKREEIVQSIENIKSDDKIKNKGKKVQNLESRLSEIDKLLNVDTDKELVILEAMRRSHAEQQELYRTKIASIEMAIQSQDRKIIASNENVTYAFSEIDKLSHESEIEKTEQIIRSRDSQSKKQQKRIDNINAVLNTNQSPVRLVFDELTNFWKRSYKTIEKTKAELDDLKNGKYSDDLKAELSKLTEDEQRLKVQELISSKEKRIADWETRQTLMSQKGLGDWTKGANLEDVLKSFTVESLTKVLRKSSTLSDKLLKNANLKTLSSVKDIAYYAGLSQDALGFKTQTEQQYIDEKTLESRFIEMLKINEYIKKARGLLSEKDVDVNPTAIQEFIDYFGHIPEMTNAVEFARQYLTEVGKLPKDAFDAETPKTYTEQIQELWDVMDKDSQGVLLNALNSSKAVGDANITEISDWKNILKTATKAFSEEDSVLKSLQTDNPQLQQILAVLQRSSLLNSTKKATNQYGEYGLLSTLFGLQKSKESVHVTTQDRGGNEKVYELYGGKVSQPSDRRFSLTPNSLRGFINKLGAKEEIGQIVDAMFDPRIIAKEKLDSEVKQLRSKLKDLKTEDVPEGMYPEEFVAAKQRELAEKEHALADAVINAKEAEGILQGLIDKLFASGKIKLSTGKNADLPMWAQDAKFGGTKLSEYDKKEALNKSTKDRLISEISALESGDYSSMSKVLEGLSDGDQQAKIAQVLAAKKAELARLQQAELTQDEIIQSLLTLEDDIQRSDAQAKHLQSESRAQNRKSDRVTDSSKAWAYKHEKDAKKKAMLDESRQFQINVGRTAHNREEPLANLLSRIEFAKANGLMDTTALEELATKYISAMESAWDITDLKHAGQASADQANQAWNDAREARDKLITTYFATDGWYATQIAQDATTTLDADIEREKLSIRESASMSGAAVDLQIAGIDAERQRLEVAADEYEAGLQEKYIRGPMRDVAIALEQNERAIETKAKEIQSRKDNLYNIADEDMWLKSQYKELEELQASELKPLQDARRNASGDEYTQIVDKIHTIEARYSQQYAQKRQMWINAEAQKLDAEYKDFVDAISSSTIEESNARSIRMFNEDMADKGIHVESMDELKLAIKNIVDAMYKSAAEQAEKAKASVDMSGVVSDEEIERRIRESKEIAEKEKAKRDKLASVRGKTDAELMAGQHATSSEAKAQQAKTEADHKAELEKQKKAYMDRYGITQEMLDAARQQTSASQALVEEARQESDAVTPSVGNKPSYGGYGGGFFGAIDTSNLATESTLRGIYQLLNGGPPEGGWDSAMASGIKEELDLSVKSFSGVLSNLASSVGRVVKDIGTRSYENMAFLNDEKLVGRYIKGDQNVIDAKRIKGFLGRHADDNLKLALHNHPDGISALSPSDIESAIALASTYGVGASGAVTADKITGVDFSKVSKELGIKVLEAYKENIKNSVFTDIFDDNFEIKSEFANSQNFDKQKLSNELNKLLQQAINSVGLNSADIFGQIDMSQLDNATKQVAEQIIESGAEVAVQSIFTKDDIKSKQTAFQEKFKTKELKGGKKGFDIDGASKIDQALYNVSDRLTKDSLTDGDLTKLTKAYDQLENAFKEEIIQHLDQETVDFLNTLRGQISSVLEANSSRLSAKDQQSKAITEAKDYLSKLKTEDGKRVSGTSRASTGIDQIYDVLNKCKEELSDKDLKSIAEGYYRLQQTVNHAVFEKLDENTKKVINDAIQEAKTVLDKYDVTVKSDELVGTVLDGANKDLFKNANKKDKKQKIGRTISAVAEPQIIKGDKVLSNASVYLDGTTKKQAEERAVAEQKITQEKREQNQLATEAAQKEEKTTTAVQERASAEQKTTETKKKAKVTTKTQSSSSGITPPESGNTQGGILGILSRIATEETLSSIAALLSKGIKTTSSEKQSGGRKSTEKKAEDVKSITSSEAYDMIAKYVGAKYQNINVNPDKVRQNASGYSADISLPKNRNLDETLELQAKINQYIANGETNTQECIEAQARLNALLKEQEIITISISANGKNITEKSNLQSLAVGAKAAVKELQTVDNMMSRLHESGAISIGDDGSVGSSNAAITKYLTSLAELQQYKNSLSSEDLFDPSVQQRLSELTLRTQNFRKEVTLLLDAIERNNIGEYFKSFDGDLMSSSASDIKKSMEDMLSQSGKTIEQFGDLETVTNKYGEIVSYQLSYSLRTGKREVQEMTASLNPLTKEIRIQEGALKTVATGWDRFFSGLKGKFSSIIQYIASITSIQDFFRYIREGVQYVREIDSALTELKKVTDEADASYSQFLQDMSKTGATIGSTVKDLTSSAADWARLGYNMKQAGELAKNTAILMNVSEFDDVSKATDTLISSLQAFKKEGQDVGTFSMQIIDKYNEVGNNYAISTSDLADSLTRSSAALVAANNSLEQSIAMTAAANTTIQDPESVGNALKTVSMRIRGVKTELEEAGEDTEGMITNTSKLQEKIMALTNVDGKGGVNILTHTGDFKSTYDILLDISKVWKEMDDVSQAALLELVAGKTRGSVVAALFQNGDVLEEAYNSAVNASGSAMNELNTYLDSIQGRIDLFNNAIQTMWMNFINADVAKWFVDLATSAIKLVDTLGLIPTILGAFVGFKSIKSIFNVFKELSTELSGVVKAQDFLTKGSQDVAISLIKEGAAATLANSSLVQYAITQGLVTAEQVASMTTTELLGTAFMGLAAKIKTATVALAKFLFTTPVGWAILAVAAITSVVVAYNAFGPTHKNFIKQLEEETEALKSVQSELKNVQSELEATKDRMDQLNAKGTLSFVEEEELNRLKQQTAELERQEEILLARENRERSKQIDTALKAAKTDANFQQVNPAVSPYMSGNSALTSSSYAASLSNENSTPDNKTYANSYEYNLAWLKKSKEDLEKAEKELSNTTYNAESKEYKKLEKAVEEAQGRVSQYNNAIDSMSDAWQTEYGEVGYIENATTEAEKQWNEFYRQHQDYLDQQALINNDYGKDTVLDRIFGVTGTDVAKRFKKEFEDAVQSGRDPSDVITEMLSNSDYSSAFSGLEEQFGITLDNIKNYFTQAGEFAIDYDFDITKYTKEISSHSAVISEFQDAIQKLDKGSFTMDDFMDLIERYPDLAKGVDISSKSFYGLSRNLKKAIKTNTKSFINDLKSLKESLAAAGKETESIDQLIEAIENMPDDALDDTIERYGTLADEIERAKVNQDRLMASMEENPNEGYETRGEAMEYMKEAMGRGEIGSESNLWNVAKEYGFTKDTAKIIDPEVESLNDYADALAEYIAIRDTWFKQDDDGNYTYEGTENFIESVEDVVDANAELQKVLKWDYDETTGVFDFDFNNEDLPQIISLLSQTKELAGLTEEEWMDLMVQVGQFFNVNWSKASDISDHITKIYEGSGTAADKIDEMTDSVETYVEKVLGTDLDFSSLTDASIDALDCDESIKQLLKTYLDLKESLEDPLNIEATIGSSESIVPLLQIEELKDSITQGAYGRNFVNTDTFTATLKEAGYTEEKIQSLIDKIKEYQGVIMTTNDDPLGLNSQNKSIGSVISALNTLGIEYQTVRGELGQPSTINITSTDLITTLQEKGWTKEQISAYLQTLSSSENGLNISIDGQVDLSKEEIDQKVAEAKTSAEVVMTPNTEAVDMYDPDDKYADVIYSVDDDNIDIYSPPTKYGTVIYNSKTGTVDGTAHAKGTAFAEGSWGAPKTETALVGELGPEILVRNGRWTTVGDNGAEFTQVKKGDIIFNHKQSEQLLKNGYVTGRGRAYASGTAFASGGGTFGRYEFDGNGGWAEYNVNNKKVDGSDAFSDAADSISDAAGSISDAADEFEEVFDWVEVRLEEIDETLSLLEATLENAIYYTEKNSIIDSMIDVNNNKLKNLKAGYQEYADYAAKLLTEVPEKYRDAVQDGAIAIEEFVGEADEATLEAINNYREWAQKAADLKQQTQEIITTIRDLAIQKFDNAYEAGDVRATVEDSQTEKLQNAVDYDEERGLITSDAYYIAMMENSNKKIEYLTNARKAMQKELNAAVEAGQIERGSNEWYELIDQMYQIDASIDEATIELEEFQNAINDLYWENLEQLTNRLDYLKDETQSLIDLMANDDLVADPQKRKYEGGTVEYWTVDDVKWTKEGLASLGLYAQQMEIAEYTARQYAEAIDDLEKDYKAGLYSENEYIEKLEELKDAQYENIEAYYDAQDAIKDLNEARVDSIKDGIEKEIEAYEELIEKQKEQLDSEKDLYDFQKSTTEQQKNIAQIERQLAALANDHSLSAAAQRKQLEAELAEAQYELQDTYYNRSVEDKQTALDKELEDFNAEKDAEIQKWDEYLTNVEALIAESLGIVQANADEIGATLTSKAEEYNLTVSDAIMTPWKDGAFAVSDYQSTFDTAMSSTMNQLEALKNKWQEIIDKMAEAGKINVDNINKTNANYAAATKKEPEVAKKPTKPAKQEKPKEKQITVGGKINAGSARIYASSNGTGGGKQYFASDPIYTVLQEKNGYLLVRYHKASSGATGWFKKSDVKAYAKGTTNLSKSGIVNIDELGEELVLRAQNGRLTYMEKGSGVIPADLTSNLMEWGKLDPTSMLEQSRPSMNVHPEIHNTEINLSMTYGDILHIDEFNGNNPEDVAKLVTKQFEKHTKDLNNALRKFTR